MFDNDEEFIQFMLKENSNNLKKIVLRGVLYFFLICILLGSAYYFFHKYGVTLSVHKL